MVLVPWHTQNVMEKVLATLLFMAKSYLADTKTKEVLCAQLMVQYRKSSSLTSHFRIHRAFNNEFSNDVSLKDF